LTPTHQRTGRPASQDDLAPTTITLPGAVGDVPARLSECGKGRPIVFLHGLVGLNDHWEDVVRLAKARTRCIMLELPLLELSGDDCSIHGVVDLTARFLDTHLTEPCVLVGNSFGGHVALRLALDRPELVRGLVLAGSSGLKEQTMVQEIQTRPTREWLSERIGELFFDRSKMRHADVDRAHKELSKRSGARAMVRLSRSARRNNLGERIGDIRVPTLIIWGREDVVTPPEAAHEFASKIKDSRLIWFDRCGHAPMIECPEEFAKVIMEFNEELDRRG
jgi:pimeloyl-ACP methyl ester carboxylesterase